MPRPPRVWRATRRIQQRARDLRRPLTPAESILWYRLRAARLDGLHFRRQHPVGPFVVDFFRAAAALVVEIDGDSHAERSAYDAQRTRWLVEEKGYRVLRFTNEDILRRLDAVLERIVAEVEARPPP